MKLSAKRKTALFNAIHEPIINLRISRYPGSGDELDTKLFDLRGEIWAEVKKALEIEDTP